jgi:NADH-quinone oxidoreductase subunit E
LALTQATREKIALELDRYPRRRSALLPALRLAQAETGYLAEETLAEVAGILDVDANALAMLATFYDLLHAEPVGGTVLSVCDGLACHLEGSGEVVRSLQDRLEIAVDGTTSDGAFTLKRMECLAACNLAPCLIVNGEDYIGHLAPENVDAVLDHLRAGARPATENDLASGHVDARGLRHANGDHRPSANGRSE